MTESHQRPPTSLDKGSAGRNRSEGRRAKGGPRTPGNQRAEDPQARQKRLRDLARKGPRS